MPLTIGALTLLGHFLLGLGLATALLLAAALAPTDPVLASDVQVGPPGDGGEDETRFALTSEAGLNDGLPSLSFMPRSRWRLPARSQPFPSAIGWRSISSGRLRPVIAVGWGVGFALGWLIFHIPNRARLSRTGDGFVRWAPPASPTRSRNSRTAMASSPSSRRRCAACRERGHAYHQKLHDFAEELERLLMMALLVLFGGALGPAACWQP